jgi:fatty acid desaturase
LELENGDGNRVSADRVEGGIPRATRGPAARAALRFVTPEELRSLSEIPRLRIAAQAAWTWALILGSMAAWALTGSVIALAAGFLVVSACQHALFLLTHDGAHYSIARRKWWNDLISDALFAAPIFYTTERYREGHLPHHTHLGDHARDLERRTWVLVRGSHLARLLVRALTGWSAARAIIGLTPEKVGARQAPGRWIAGVLLTNGGLLAYCWALGAPFTYVWLWLAPLFTLTYLLLIVRAVAEHQPESYARRAVPDEGVDLTPVLTRTFAAGPIERFFFAPVGAHHHEHHLFPGVPFAQLPRLHATLAARGYFDALPDCKQTSYWRLLARMARLAPDAALPPAQARHA